MKPRHQVSRVALELIKSFEGFRDVAAQLPDGRWTIGHGHTRTARQGAQVSADDARDLLIYDLLEVTAALNGSVFAPLSQNQFDALASFVFNIGVDSFRGSAVLRRLNEGELLKAAYSMELWRKAEFEGEVVVIDALVRRRAAEKTLFLTPVDGFVAAPTPLLKPRLDEEARDYAPVQTPVEIVPSLQGDQVTTRRAEPPLIAQPVEDAAPSLTELISTGGKDPAATPIAPPETVEPFPSLAAHRSADAVAYDGQPTSAPTVEDETPLPPSPESTAGEALAPVDDPVIEPSQPVADAEASQPLETPVEVATFDATRPAARTLSPRTKVVAAVAGVVGVVLFVTSLVQVYRGRYEHTGMVGPAVAMGVAGIICIAVVLFILMDNQPAHDD